MEIKVTRTATAIATATILVAGEAMAKPNCNNSLCAYDKNNQSVGTLVQEDVLIRFYGLKPYAINFNIAGFVPNLTFVYTSNDCQGTPYILSTTGLPDQAYFDGTSHLWSDAVTPTIQTLIINSKMEYFSDNGALKSRCIQGGTTPIPPIELPGSYEVTIPVLLDGNTNRFVPPFLVR